MRLFRRRRKKPEALKKIGLALGGGGARGLAHINVLEVLDEMKIRPHAISGTSIGSIMGVMYASGLSGSEIRNLVNKLLLKKIRKFTDVFTRSDLIKWMGMLDPAFHKGSLLKGERFVRFLLESMKCTTFEELKTPLYISTTDFCSGKEEVFTSGDLLSAVRASMAIPGVFAPVERDGKMLIDGGLVNPLPYNLLRDECDVVIAVDVCGSLEKPLKRPDLFDMTLGSFDIVQAALIAEQLQLCPPDVYLKPDLQGVRILEFNKSDVIFEQSEPIRDMLREQIKVFI